MSPLFRVILFMLLFAAGFFGWFFLVGSEPLRFGANAEPQKLGIERLIYGFLVTLVGVFFGSAFHELKRLKEGGQSHIKPLKFFVGLLSSIEIWMGFCASPIVYALLMKNLGGGSDAGLTVIALENGFCCTLIASKVLGGTNKEV